jgi:dihydrofolate reductase
MTLAHCVRTHDVPRKIAKGENEKLKFTFVTDGLKSALEQARAAAGNRNVSVIGGASIARQMIKAGFFDELQIAIAPILLGKGLRLFKHLDDEIELEKIRESAPMGTATLTFFAAK